MFEPIWSPWIALDADLATYNQHIPATAGFYRIRSSKVPGLVYIGQTGRSSRLRTRGELARNVLRDSETPPWNDPHTAAPVLWAFRHEDGMEFEVSASIYEKPTQYRQCQEDALLYLHRMAYGHSTLCNHGRRHPLWTRASNRKEGRPTIKLAKPVDFTSLPVAIGEPNPLAQDWLGLEWSDFAPLTSRFPLSAGVYRIADRDSLIYIGESRSLAARLSTHSKDRRFQNCLVSQSSMPDALPHQLKEREADLVGAYFLEKHEPPACQYSPGTTKNIEL